MSWFRALGDVPGICRPAAAPVLSTWLLLLACLFTSTAEAQSPPEPSLVRNYNQNSLPGSSHRTRPVIPINTRVTQGFRTGAHPLGYALDTIAIVPRASIHNRYKLDVQKGPNILATRDNLSRNLCGTEQAGQVLHCLGGDVIRLNLGTPTETRLTLDPSSHYLIGITPKGGAMEVMGDSRTHQWGDAGYTDWTIDDSAGGLSTPVLVEIKGAPILGAPRNLTASESGRNWVIEWNPPLHHATGAIVDYEVLRCSGSCATSTDFTTLGTVSASSPISGTGDAATYRYTHTNAPNNIAVHYRVRARNSPVEWPAATWIRPIEAYQVTITSRPDSGNTYRYDENVDIAVWFNVPVTVTGSLVQRDMSLNGGRKSNET